MSTTPTSASATAWLYAAGAPMYQARAFGDYFAEFAHTLPFSDAKRQFDYDPRSAPFVHRYGSTCYGKHLSEMCAECRTRAQFGD